MTTPEPHRDPAVMRAIAAMRAALDKADRLRSRTDSTGHLKWLEAEQQVQATGRALIELFTPASEPAPDTDIPIKQAGEYLARLAALGFDRLWLEWTCVGCGERAKAQVHVMDNGKSLGIHNRYMHGFTADGSPCGHTAWVHEVKFTPSGTTNSPDTMNKLFNAIGG